MIEQLHWDAVGPTEKVPSIRGPAQWLAIWPSPVDADACFSEAGFHDFADTDDSWDSAWRSILRAIFEDFSARNPSPT